LNIVAIPTADQQAATSVTGVGKENGGQDKQKCHPTLMEPDEQKNIHNIDQVLKE